MAFVDLKRDKLCLKIVLAGPPASGKSTRLAQIADVGARHAFGSSIMGKMRMASLPLELEGEGRPAELEVYEWHGHEKADIRAHGLFVGLDGLVYVVDARAERRVDTVNQFDFLQKTVGRRKLQRVPGLLALGMGDEGRLRLADLEPELAGQEWVERVEAPHEDAQAFLDAVRRFAAAVLARAL